MNKRIWFPLFAVVILSIFPAFGVSGQTAVPAEIPHAVRFAQITAEDGFAG